MITIERARQLRALIEQAATFLSDADASKGVELFPGLKGDGSLVSHGTRITFNGKLYRAAVDLWDTAENTPDTAPTLWEELLYRDGIRIIPETITVGLAFSSGELGWWGDELYRSKVDSNVYTPDEYAQNWEKVEQ